MRIESRKHYKVVKFFGDNVNDYGILPCEDVKRLLRGYTWDDTFGMFFSPKANIGYDVKEVA